MIARKSDCMIWLAALLFVLAVAFSIVPLSSTEVVVHGDFEPVVPLFNAWAVWWNSRVCIFSSGYWDAPIFAPSAGTFAFSEPQPITGLLAPLVWLGWTPVLVHNVYSFVTVLLNGVFGGVCATRLARSSLVGGFAAIAFASLPVLANHLHVIQLAAVWPVVWLWSSLFAARDCPGWLSGVWFGLATGLMFWVCVHHGLFHLILLGVALPCVLWPFRRQRLHWLDRDRLKCLAAFGLTTVLLAAPIVLPMKVSLDRYEFERSDQFVERLSAKPRHYVQTPASIWSPGPTGLSEGAELWPGAAVLVLASVGMVAAVRKKVRWAITLAAVGVVAFTLSFGATLRWGDWSPWFWIADRVPGLAQVRSVHRFGMFTHLCLILLACAGLQWFIEAARSLRQSLRITLRVIAIGLAVGCVLEQFPVRKSLSGVPRIDANADWIQAVRKNTTPESFAMCLPMGQGTDLASFRPEAEWMYQATVHGQRLFNGYSGFFPRDYMRFREQLGNGTLAADDWTRLYNSGLRVLVVDRRRAKLPTLPTTISVFPLHDDPDGFSVYRLNVEDEKAGDAE